MQKINGQTKENNMSFKTKFTAAAVAISLALAGTGCSSSGG